MLPRKLSLSVLALATGFIVACSMASRSSSSSPSPMGSMTTGSVPKPERSVRRDIPITNAIRHAFAEGTRDSTGRPGRNYWQLRTDYTIDARLDPSTQRLTGHETVVIRNHSPDSLTQIGLRLDMNHFLFASPRAAPWVASEETDGMVVTRVTVNGQPVNLNPPQFGRGGGRGGGRGELRTENALTGIRSTLAAIDLLHAIPAHGTATVEIDWNHKIPGAPGSYAHRMDQRWGDTLFQPTQWYPRVRVYDDLRGWDPELYLGPSEFYNNFGRFDVRLDVPAGWIVSGTGVLQNPNEVLTAAERERLSHVLESDSVITISGPNEVGPGEATAAGDRLVWHMVADTVNDFAWATAKKYVWRATRATIPGKRPVPIHMVYLPGDSLLYTNAGPVARHALEFYSKLWFPYEFPKFTLQDGPSAGMEYPMVINSNQGAADHETGHQWWPMTVSNNETWYGWMDEGFNQYMNIPSDADAAAKGIIRPRGNNPILSSDPTNPLLFDGRGESYGFSAARLGEAEAPMMWDANYAGPTSYSFTTYSKTPLMLSMLGGIVGDSAVQGAHSEWAKAWRFKHPSPWDYMFFMNNALHQDLGWFWYYWLFTTETVDGSIEKVETSGTGARVTVHQDGQMPAPVVLKVDFADSTSTVVTFPVDVWFNGSKTYVATLNFPNREIRKITLDPAGRFPDRDPTDNVWPRKQD